ncbi:MAG: BON domain-containing protein [Chroococcus sp. CMT-3BRIN-NPC107]|jgi:osmotically-inducible protein OsmY|nr:BON domain-containing protein [Chroococcus sp. CMT-3BRIN-NPC107]
MGWLKRLFGMEKPQNAPSYAPQQQSAPQAQAAPAGESIPPERRGLSGEYDQSGLAKRVALEFDEEPDLDDIETIYVAQTGSVVVLKGKAPSQQLLNKMVSVAQRVNGATEVNTDSVEVD